MSDRLLRAHLAPFALLAACGAHTGSTDAATGSDAADRAACAVTADCRLFSASCSSCTCVALRADAADPVCDREPVACRQDPCAERHAACDTTAGHCVVR